MTVYSFFHNSVNGDRKYESGDFAELTNAILSDGIVEDLYVNYTNAYAFTIDAGKAIVMGRLVINDSIITSSIPSPTLNDKYSVVVRMDLTTRSATIETILGTSYQDDNAIKQIPLAEIVVGNNTLTITDVRKYAIFRSNKILLQDSKLVYDSGHGAFDTIAYKEGSDYSGVGMAIGGGGTTLIGGGESALYTMLSALVNDAVQEKLLLTSDYEVQVWTGMQNVKDDATVGKRFIFNTNGDFNIGGNNIDAQTCTIRYTAATKTFQIYHWTGTAVSDTVILEVGDISFQNAPWLNLTLASGISDYTSGNNAKYKRKGGIVYIKGAVKGITSLNKVIATLPSGYRPTGSSHSFTAPTSGKNHARWVINTDGTIQLENVSQTTLPAVDDFFPIHTCFPID